MSIAENSYQNKILTLSAVSLKKKIDIAGFSNYFLGISRCGVFVCKVLNLKDLRQITVIGAGLLGASLTLAVKNSFQGVSAVIYSHRAATRAKARKAGVADKVVDDIGESVRGADIVILATPISTFEKIFAEIKPFLKSGCIVSDVGSTKVKPVRWAKKIFKKDVCYIGSHPIAGSEQRGVEFARDDLFAGAVCILTPDKDSEPAKLKVLSDFWAKRDCEIAVLGAAEHDRIFCNVSHLPHITAAALVNASSAEELKFAGKGFVDTSRIASGPENIWADILCSNSSNCTRAIDRLIRELKRIQQAVKAQDKDRIEKLLAKARGKRSELIRYKLKKESL